MSSCRRRDFHLSSRGQGPTTIVVCFLLGHESSPSRAATAIKMAKITRPSKMRCNKPSITFALLFLEPVARSLYCFASCLAANQTPEVAISQISRPEKKTKNMAVTTMIGNRQPLSLMASGRARVFSTISITE